MPRICLGMLLVGALGGCGLGSITSGIGGGMFGSSGSSKPAPGPVTEEQLLSAAKADVTDGGGGFEVAHGCPRIQIAPRENHVTIYERGRVGDGLAVMHRGEITKTARECQIESGRVTVKYGFSGRVLLGPRGNAGPISLPITMMVNDSRRDRVAQDKMKVDVVVAVDKPIGYFSMVRTVTFNVPEGSRPGEFEVLVGFDRSVPNAG